MQFGVQFLHASVQGNNCNFKLFYVNPKLQKLIGFCADMPKFQYSLLIKRSPIMFEHIYKLTIHHMHQHIFSNTSKESM